MSCLAKTAVSYVQVPTDGAWLLTPYGASGRDLLGPGLEAEAAALEGAGASATCPAAVVTNRRARVLAAVFIKTLRVRRRNNTKMK